LNSLDIPNERCRYHGTSHEIANIIATNGFDERLASLDGLYGAGAYFAQESCKALQYAANGVKVWSDAVTGEDLHKTTKVILISRVVLGDPSYTTKAEAASGKHKSRRRPPDKEGKQGLL
jgi:hypothetical protein